MPNFWNRNYWLSTAGDVGTVQGGEVTVTLGSTAISARLEPSTLRVSLGDTTLTARLASTEITTQVGTTSLTTKVNC